MALLVLAALGAEALQGLSNSGKQRLQRDAARCVYIFISSCMSYPGTIFSPAVNQSAKKSLVPRLLKVSSTTHMQK